MVFFYISVVCVQELNMATNISVIQEVTESASAICHIATNSEASAIPEPSDIPQASVIPQDPAPKLPDFTPAATATLTPTVPIPAPIPGQTLVMSPSWIEHPLRYKAAMTPPTGVPAATLITPEVEPVFMHVSYF